MAKQRCKLFAFIMVLITVSGRVPAQLTELQKAQRPLSVSLIKAIKAGDSVTVARLLNEGADPNTRDVGRTTPSLRDHTEGNKPILVGTALILSVQKGNAEIASLLLHKGADVNGVFWDGYTPLMAAINHRSEAMVKLLLDHGAKPDLRTRSGMTAMLHAANRGMTKVVGMLQDRGANINGMGGWTPLMEAAYNWQKETVEFLLQKGADVNRRDSKGLTALDHVLDRAASEVVDVLKKAGGTCQSPEERRKTNEIIHKKYKQEDATRKARNHANALKWSRERELTEEDRLVIETALTDMIHYKGKDFFLLSDIRQGVSLLNETLGPPFWVFSDANPTDVELDFGLDVTQSIDVSLEMRENLQRRNWEPVSLDSLRLRDDSIFLVGKDRPDSRPPVRRLGGRCWACIRLPAYSRTHDKAVLYFAMGPSSHGAAGTYFLTKAGNEWKVKWRNFSQRL